MSGLSWIDALFAAFVASLPEHLRPEARALAHTLRLAPSPDVPWSEVFSHEVTLAAPALVAEAAAAPDDAVRLAVLAHLLAIVEAFGSDRIADGQIRPSPSLLELLAAARAARDRSIAGLAPRAADPLLDYANADRETAIAVALEHELLSTGASVSFPRYLAVSLGKQRLGIPASLALAHAAAWEDRRRRALAATLEDVYLGLQLNDDVVDWEDDLRLGGAWAVALAGSDAAQAGLGRDPALVRDRVHGSAALALMLLGSERCFRRARRRARALGLSRLAAWAGEREAHVGALARGERERPGYANRAHALGVWAKAVLS